MSSPTCSAGFLVLEDLGFIFVPCALGRTPILIHSQPQLWAMGADGEQEVAQDIERNSITP